MSSPSTPELSLPGYRVEPGTGALLSLPWPDPRPPSLGPAVIRWAHKTLLHHLTGEPWQFTVGQCRFLHMWYAVRPDGTWLYRSGVKRGAKGTGKDPMAAAVCWCEMAGPVRFAGWAKDGSPIGAPYVLPLVQIAANSEAQAKDVLRVANAMVSRAMREDLGVDAGETRTLIDSGGRLELLTSSQKSAEGDPATAITLNESHHMTDSNGGADVAAVARRNVAKSPYGQARLLEYTNAHEEGADSVAERSYLAWQAQASGRAARQDILYDSRESPPSVDIYDETSRRAGLAAAYSDSPWSSLERFEDEMLDPRVSVSESLRFYLNVIGSNEAAWVEPRNFDALARPDLVVADGDALAMFLDCSKSSDSTALMGCRTEDGHLVTLGVWQRPPGERGKGWLAPKAEVDAAVRAAFDRYTVQWFGVDPSPATDDDSERSYWMPLVDGWHRDFRAGLAVPVSKASAVLFDMRDRAKVALFVQAALQTQADIDSDGALSHDGDATLRTHVHNARRYPTQYGISLGKANRWSTKLVDLAVAMVGARMGRRECLNATAGHKKKTGVAHFL